MLDGCKTLLFKGANNDDVCEAWSLVHESRVCFESEMSRTNQQKGKKYFMSKYIAVHDDDTCTFIPLTVSISRLFHNMNLLLRFWLAVYLHSYESETTRRTNQHAAADVSQLQLKLYQHDIYSRLYHYLCLCATLHSMIPKLFLLVRENTNALQQLLLVIGNGIDNHGVFFRQYRVFDSFHSCLCSNDWLDLCHCRLLLLLATHICLCFCSAASSNKRLLLLLSSANECFIPSRIVFWSPNS